MQVATVVPNGIATECGGMTGIEIFANGRGLLGVVEEDLTTMLPMHA